MSDPVSYAELIIGEVHLPICRALDAMAAPPHEAMDRLHLCILCLADGGYVIGQALADPVPPPVTPRSADAVEEVEVTEDTEAVRLAARAHAISQLTPILPA